MRTMISRWFLFGLLVGWSLTHATVFGQPAKTDTKPPSAADKIRQALDKQITVDYTANSLQDALNHIKDKSGLPISLDNQALMMMGGVANFIPPDPNNPVPGIIAPQIRVKANNEKASHVLRKLLNQHQLSYFILENSVLVTTEDNAVMRQMRQRVSVDLDEVPLKKAVRDLARNHGVSLVIDPKIARDADAAISLQLDNTGIETALRLMAEMASLKAVRMGNVVFITSEEKAKRILEEEKHQFDNPLNPNAPTYYPPIMRGGAFGGIAMPAVAPPAFQVAPALPPPVAEPIVAPRKEPRPPNAPPRNPLPQAPPPPGPPTVPPPSSLPAPPIER